MPGDGEAATTGSATSADEVVLRFPVEVEVRMVAPYDPEQLIDTALDRLTTALRGLT